MIISRRTFLLGSLAFVIAGCKLREQNENYTPEAADKILLSKTANDLRKVYKDVQAFEIIRPAKNYLLGPYVYGFDGENVHVYSKKGEALFKMYEISINGERRIVQDFAKNGGQNECLTTGYDPDWKKWHMKEVNTLHKTKNGEINITTNGVLEPF